MDTGHASPEAAIRSYLDDRKGPVEATVAHLLTTFDVTVDGLDGRGRITEALAGVGVKLDRDLALLGVDEEINLTVIDPVTPVQPATRGWRGPMAALVLGPVLAVGAGALALGVFIQMQSAQGSYVAGLLDSAAQVLGADAPAGGDTPLWLILLFVAAIALSALGLLMTVMGGIWLLARGTRYAATSQTTRRGIALTGRASRKSAHLAHDLSHTGYVEAKELASSGARWSRPRLAREAARFRSRRQPDAAPAQLTEGASKPDDGLS